jgi:holin-like protein
MAMLLGFWAAGEALASVARLPMPGSVAGMLLLAGALRLGWMPLVWVRPAAELLVRHMGLLFVPPGVGLMLYLDLIGREWVAITCAAVASTLLVLLTVGFLMQRMERRG